MGGLRRRSGKDAQHRAGIRASAGCPVRRRLCGGLERLSGSGEAPPCDGGQRLTLCRQHGRSGRGKGEGLMRGADKAKDSPEAADFFVDKPPKLC